MIDWLRTHKTSEWLPGFIGGLTVVLLLVFAANWSSETRPAPSAPAAAAPPVPSPAERPAALAPPASVAGAPQQVPRPLAATPPDPVAVHQGHAAAPPPQPSAAPRPGGPASLAQLAPPAPSAAPSAQPASKEIQAGRLVFRKCQACHSLENGKNGLGPSLAGIVGKKAGSVPGYN